MAAGRIDAADCAESARSLLGMLTRRCETARAAGAPDETLEDLARLANIVVFLADEVAHFPIEEAAEDG